MRKALLFIATTVALVAGSMLRAQTSPVGSDTLAVAERYLDWPDAITAVSLDASFRSTEARAALLDLGRLLGTSGGRPVRLGDVLVNLNLDGQGVHAFWQLVGPRPLLVGYVEQLERARGAPEGLHDLVVHVLVPACACDR